MVPATGAMRLHHHRHSAGDDVVRRLRRTWIVDHVQLGAAAVAKPFDGQVLQSAARAGDRIPVRLAVFLDNSTSSVTELTPSLFEMSSA